MANMLNQQPRWESIDKSEVPLRTAMEEYLTACRTEGKTVKTLSDYRQKLTRFVEWHDGELGGFTLAKARAFVARLQETPKWSTHTTIQTSSQMLSAQTVAGHARSGNHALKGLSGPSQTVTLCRRASRLELVNSVSVLSGDPSQRPITP